MQRKKTRLTNYQELSEKLTTGDLSTERTEASAQKGAAEQIAGKIALPFLAVQLDDDYLGCRGPELIKDVLEHYQQMVVMFMLEGHFSVAIIDRTEVIVIDPWARGTTLG